MKLKHGSNSASFRLNGAAVPVVIPTQEPAGLEFNDLSELQALIDAAADGATIDLGGAHYISSTDRGGQSITHSQITLPTTKSITIQNGNFYGGFEPIWLADQSNTFGPGVYRATCDFLTDGEIVSYPPFLWSSYEKAPKQAIYPPNERDVEFGSVWAGDASASDDYALGNTPRVQIVTGSTIRPVDGYLVDHSGRTFVFAYDVNTQSVVTDDSWSALTTQISEGTDYGLAEISASKSSGSWVVNLVFDSSNSASTYEASAGKVMFVNPGVTSAEVSHGVLSRVDNVISFTSDMIGNLVQSWGVSFAWEIRLAHQTVGGVVFTDVVDVPAIVSAFNFDETGGLIDDSRGCALNVQSSDNRSFWCPVQFVQERLLPNEIEFRFSDGFTSLNYSNVSTYLNAAIFGPPPSLQAGQIVFLPESQTMYWKPRDSRSLSASVLGIASDPLFEVANNYVYPDTLDDLSSGSKVIGFDSCAMNCGRQMLKSTAARVGALVHIQDCEFKYANLAVDRVQGLVERCVFDQCFYAQLYGSSGLTVDKCWFGATYQVSNINISGVPDSSYPVPNGGTQGNGFSSVVTNSFFCNPFTEHGQCVSFYQGSCNNAVFNGNIVFNTQRGCVMSPITPGSGTIRTDQQPYRFEMKCNLFVEDDYKNITGPVVWNQQNFADVYDHGSDSFYSSTDEFPDFRFLVASNTHVSLKTSTTPSRFIMNSLSQPFRITSRMHNNYLQGAAISFSSMFPSLTSGKTDVVRMSNNFWTQRCQSYSTTNCAADTGQVAGIAESNDRNGTIGCYLSGSTLVVTDSALLNGATDGGIIGARWTGSAPSLSDVIAIKDRDSGYQAWYNTFVADIAGLPDDEAIYVAGSTPDDTWLEPGIRNAPDLGVCP